MVWLTSLVLAISVYLAGFGYWWLIQIPNDVYEYETSCRPPGWRVIEGTFSSRRSEEKTQAKPWIPVLIKSSRRKQ